MTSSVHTNEETRIDVVKTGGMSSNLKLCFIDLCEVYMTDEKLDELYFQIGIHLKTYGRKPLSEKGIRNRIEFHMKRGESKQVRKWNKVLQMNHGIGDICDQKPSGDPLWHNTKEKKE